MQPPANTGVVVEIKGIVQLHYSWWRHPILWWKTRHLLPDFEEAERLFEEEVSDPMAQLFREKQNDAFINGTGEREGP